jgi:hypothetical protein
VFAQIVEPQEPVRFEKAADWLEPFRRHNAEPSPLGEIVTKKEG